MSFFSSAKPSPAKPAPAPQKKALPPGMIAAGEPECSILKAQLEQGDLSGLRAYLARTLADSDWQDRAFILPLVVSSIRRPALDFACDTDPHSADLFLIRCVFYAELAAEMRGGGTCDQLTENGMKSAAEAIKAALADLAHAARLEPNDPTAFTCILSALTIFGETAPHQHQAFNQAMALDPDLVSAWMPIINARSKRWHGSHEQSLGLARRAIASATPGSDIYACLFSAHVLIYTHSIHFDKKPDEAKAYLKRDDVLTELANAFDAWTAAPYAPRRSSTPLLHFAAFWFHLAEDRPRLKRALELIGNSFSPAPWNRLGNSVERFGNAALFAAGEPNPDTAARTPAAECLSFLYYAREAVRFGKVPDAEKGIEAAMQMVRLAPQPERSYLEPLALLHLSWLRRLQKNTTLSSELYQKAIAQLDVSNNPDTAEAALQIAETLVRLDDHRRACPFWELTLALCPPDFDAIKMADILHHAGQCYRQLDMHDHAAISMRAALKVFSQLTGDPRLPILLMDLGMALRKSSPIEAEAFLNQSADIYTSQMQFQSATPVWSNLGMLCSNQGRCEEAHQYYEKVLRVREQTPGTPPARIAQLLNNMGCNLARMHKPKEAHAAVDRALKLVPSSGALTAHLYGTRAMAFIEAGDDKRAVEWLRKANTEMHAQHSPSLTTIAENLEREIAALHRLGKDKEAASAQQELLRTHARNQNAPAPTGTVDAGTLAVSQEGAVLVELPATSLSFRETQREQARLFTDKLSRHVRARQVGKFGGLITTPETTTLLFYGPDSESLFNLLDRELAAEDLCAGARVVIRQGATHREVLVNAPAMAYN